MNEEEQIQAVLSAAKSAPTKIGVVIDDHKEERFMTKLRAGLPEEGFKLVCAQMMPKVKVITITRVRPVDAQHN